MPTLINSVTQLQQYVEVGDGLSWQSIAPSVFLAESSLLTTYLGLKLYRHLTGNQSVSDYQDLIEYACNASAKLALWFYSSRGGMQITDMGIYQAKTSDIWRLSENEMMQLRNSFLADGMDSVNLLLECLEENAEAPASDLPEADYTAFQLWYTSPIRKKIKGLLIKSADVFSQYVDLYRSSLTYYSLVFDMVQSERQRIAPLMGGYYATLKAMENPAGNDALLMTLAQEALAKSTAATSLQRGLHLMENARLSFAMNHVEPQNEQINFYVSEAERALQRLRAKLEELKPAGYVPLTSAGDVLRKEGARIILG